MKWNKNLTHALDKDGVYKCIANYDKGMIKSMVDLHRERPIRYILCILKLM